MKIKIIFLIFLSLNLWSQEPFKIEKKYFQYEKISDFECNIESKIVYYYKNTFTGKISTNEIYDMNYKCFHHYIYIAPRNDYTLTPTPTPCKCEENSMWIKEEGILKINKE